jgi:hypothetical protein
MLVSGCRVRDSVSPLASTRLSPDSSSSVPLAPPKRKVALAVVTSREPS